MKRVSPRILLTNFARGVIIASRSAVRALRAENDAGNFGGPLADFLAVSAVKFLGLLGWRASLKIGSAVGVITRWASPRKRPRTSRNLDCAGVADYGPASDRAWRHAGQTAAEIMWSVSQRPHQALRRMRIVGLDVLRDAAKEGNGVLLVSGHLGNWEFVSFAAGQAGVPVAVVAEPMRTRRLGRRVIAFRQRGNVRTLMRGGASVVAARWLLRGGVLGCMMDRTRQGTYRTVPFLGQAAYIPLGPTTLACRSGAAVVLGCAERLADGSTEVIFKRVATGPARDPWDLAGRVGLALEEAVRSHPEQWLWIFRRQPQLAQTPVETRRKNPTIDSAAAS